MQAVARECGGGPRYSFAVEGGAVMTKIQRRGLGGTFVVLDEVKASGFRSSLVSCVRRPNFARVTGDKSQSIPPFLD